MMKSKILKFWSALTLVLLVLAGCSAQQGMLPKALYGAPDAVGNSVKTEPEQPASALVVTVPPAPPAPHRLSSVKKAPTASDKVETADISLSFDQIPLTSFIQVSFGTILKKNYSVDPQVAVRTDLVTLRTSAAQTPSQVLTTVTMLLKTYGIAVTELGGFYRIAPDKDQSAYAPEIRRGRAQPDVPLPLRPIYNLVELTAVRTPEVSSLLKSMFGQKLNIQDSAVLNSLLISGQPNDVNAALEAIQVLDQPLMRGRGSRRIVPTSLSAEELAKKLVEVLSAEGYSVSGGLATAGTTTPIVLIPAPTSNSLLAFAADPAILDHVVAWARQLDTADNSSRRNGTYFTYPVKFADAQDVAKTMQEILASTASTASASTTAGGAGATGTTARAPSRIVVNAATNTLIFVSSQDQYSQLADILKELDQPSKSALIEVTVAEVNVTDENQLGVTWTMNPLSTGNGTVLAQTAAGLALGTGGLSVNFLNSASQVKASLSALANNKKANILSTPRIMARNGEQATISVGDQVPIITSQLSNANTQVAGTSGTLQTIQYLPTGVILKVKPVIHSGNRIELDVSQEVSSASLTNTGVSSSPTISTRKLDTKLSIRDGATVLLGGLMSTNDTKNDVGVPWLKDIPGLGQLFRTNSDSVQKTELIVLITPYIIDDDLVAEQVTQAFRDQLGPWAQTAPGNPPKPKVVRPQTDISASKPMRSDTPEMGKQPSASISDAPVETTPETARQENMAPEEVPVLPPGPQPGAKITDPKLLEELKKAMQGNGK